MTRMIRMDSSPELQLFFLETNALSDRSPHVKNPHAIANVEENAQSPTGRDITLLYKVEPGSCESNLGQ
jgi:DNA mismatch repair protein MSH2